MPAYADKTREYIYDDHGSLTQSKKTDALSGAELITSYVYDPVGNRIRMTEGEETTSYTYNGLDQLVSASAGDIMTEYSYDERGNQVREEVSRITGEESAETAETEETVSMTYAVTGEMSFLSKKEGDVITLSQINIYDQNGQRIRRSQDGTERTYHYDNGTAVFTKDGEEISSANILSEDGSAIATYRGEDYYSYLSDMQGSTTNIVKENGSLAAAYDYTDFGETEEITGSSFDNQICYTGGIYDKESGLYYLNARYYDPETGRFISQDTYRGELDDPNQWHLYAYCANDPINYTDPSGHKRYGSSIVTERVLLKSPKKGGIIIYADGLKWKRHKKTKKIKVLCVPAVYAKCDRPSYAFIEDTYISHYNQWTQKIKLKIVYKHYRPKLQPTEKCFEQLLDTMGRKPTKYVIFTIWLNGNAKTKSKVYKTSTYTCKPEEYNSKKY